MKRYHDAMEHCAPPPELEARLREKVLSAERAARPAVYRPRGFFRKAVLAAVIAAALTVSVGAAVLVNWDAIFSDRFGPEGAETPMAEKAFQEVGVTSICDDVALTVRQALVSEKTVYLVLDYHLPDTVDRTLVQQADSSDGDSIRPPQIGYYPIGGVSWEDLKAADQEKWAALDWTDFTSYGNYTHGGNALWAHHLSGSSSQVESWGYDPEANALTYLCSVTAKDGELDFTAQPLTLLVTPPVLWVDGAGTAVADHPAILTFQPAAVGQTLTGARQESGRTIQVSVSPFAVSVTVSGGAPYQEIGELRADTALVYRDGTIQPVSELTTGLTGGGSRDGAGGAYHSAAFISQFDELLDVSRVEAVRVGDVTVPLE